MRRRIKTKRMYLPQGADESERMALDVHISRRRFLQMGAGAAAGTLLLPVLPEAARAEALVDPYSGSIPLVFPLVYGSYKTPVQDNWHANREGQIYTWNHRNGTSQRAHDGVDIYPSRRRKLPRVYAPLTGKVAAVCVRSSNTINATVTYKVSGTTPPPWDYSQAVDNVANLPLYGNFVWLYSTDANSLGYFVFFCHLKNETTIQSLAPDQPITVNTPLGVMARRATPPGRRSCTPRSTTRRALASPALTARRTRCSPPWIPKHHWFARHGGHEVARERVDRNSGSGHEQ